MVCVTFKTCTAAIRASSCVSLSSLLSASSISVLPISLFIYFSNHRSVEEDIFIYELLTRTALPHLLRRNGQDSKDLSHNLCNDIRHCRSRRYLDVALKALEKVFDSFEDVDECILACLDILGHLGSVDVKIDPRKGIKNTH